MKTIKMVHFGSSEGWKPTDDWFMLGILNRLVSSYNFTPQQIFNCQTSDVNSHQKLKTKIISNYGKEANVKEAFDLFGF
ncbi:MAG TPA: hypothetical protein PKV50_04335 [Prolixibacteraceae bacterium]|nr:hypothetical protein [Prolixibacteraceae bacterium]